MKCEKCGSRDGVCGANLIGDVKAGLCLACLRAHARRVRATPEFAECNKAETELDYLHQCARAGSRPEYAAWMMWQDKYIAALGELREISERWLAEDKPAEPEPAKGDPGGILAEVVRTWTRDHRFVPCIADALAQYDAAIAAAQTREG